MCAIIASVASIFRSYTLAYLECEGGRGGGGVTGQLCVGCLWSGDGQRCYCIDRIPYLFRRVKAFHGHEFLQQQKTHDAKAKRFVPINGGIPEGSQIINSASDASAAHVATFLKTKANVAGRPVEGSNRGASQKHVSMAGWRS